MWAKDFPARLIDPSLARAERNKARREVIEKVCLYYKLMNVLGDVSRNCSAEAQKVQVGATGGPRQTSRSRAVWTVCTHTNRRYGTICRLLPPLLVLAVAGPVVGADTDKPHAQKGSDTTQVTDTLSDLQTFNRALDSVYTSIAGTYYGIAPILKKSCYDCHSDATRYPWYYKIPGIHGMIDNDIREARKRVDFSKGVPLGGRGSLVEQLSNIKEEIESGGMPLWTYRMMHWDSQIEGTERDSVVQWIDSSLASIRRVKANYGIEDTEPKD